MTNVQATGEGAELRTKAVERLKKKRDLWTHLFSYVLINTVIVVIWAMTGSGFFQPPVLGQNLADDPLAVLVAADVALMQGDSVAVPLGEALGGLGVVHVAGGHLGSRRQHAFADGEADTPGAACDQHDLSIHGALGHHEPPEARA
jgi:hypothetical protein